MESNPTQKHVYTHELMCSQIHTKHVSTWTHTDKYSYMFTNVYTLTQKPIVQHTDMYSHRYTYVHIQACTNISMHTDICT